MYFAVVDDEPGILKLIPELMKRLSPDVKIETDCFQGSAEFLAAYSAQKYDALFLDIDMPGINGFELAEYLRNYNDPVPIVYITSREDLVIQAFRYKALGFVRKQFMEREMPFALSTIQNEICKNDDVIEVTETRASGGRTHCIHMKQIMYLESIRHNVVIHLTDKREITVRKPLSFFAEQEKFAQFTSITSGVLVNLSLIELTEATVRFPDGTELFISRRKLPFVRAVYLDYMKRVLI